MRALLVPSPVGGVYARTGLFETVIEGLAFFISRHRDPGTEVLRFPPVMSRTQLERSGYLHSFPHLLGSVSCLKGSEATIRAVVDQPDWVEQLSATELVLSPAACYPVYPMAAARGPIPPSGLVFDVASDCFRHESTSEIGRFQSFRMREFVCLGTPQQVLDFRSRWLLLGQRLAKQLGLEHRIAPASDPFFWTRRQIGGDEPAGTVVEVRAASCDPLRGRADCLHEFQLPSQPLQRGLEFNNRERRRGSHWMRGVRSGPSRAGVVQDAWS
jgi:hypothetical protein